MMIKTKALVIKEHIFGESDKFITLFTKDMGRIQVVAPKAKKSDKGLASATQLFVYGDFMIMSYGEVYRLVNVEIIEMFHNIRNNLDALSYASYIAELVHNITQPALPQKELLKLTLVTLQKICKENADYNKIRRVYEIRALGEVGFMLHILGCTECGEVIDEQGQYYFSAAAGGLICDRCVKEDNSYNNKSNDLVEISYPTYCTLYYILSSTNKDLYNFSVDSEICTQLNKIADRYIGYYIDKKFKTLDFIESLI